MSADELSNSVYLRIWPGSMPLALALTAMMHIKSDSLSWASTGAANIHSVMTYALHSGSTLCLLSCRDGITFALQQLEDTVGDAPTPPPNLDFLQILSEFSYRLLEVDRSGKKGVATYLEDQLPEGLWGRVEGLAEWEPLRSYFSTLTGREQATDTANLSKQV